MLSGRDPCVDTCSWGDFTLIKLGLKLGAVSLFGGAILRFK